MIFRALAEADPGPSPAEKRRRALSSAAVLRDCSLRTQTTADQRKACRTLMRQAAFHWRRGSDAGAWCA